MINEKKPHILIVLFICLIQFLSAQSAFSSQQVAAGYSTSYNQDDFANALNPTSLINLSHAWNISASHEQRYFSDINASHLLLSRSWKTQGISFQFFNYGISEFKTNLWTISYARALSQSLTIGTQLTYERLIIKENGSDGGINLNLNLSQAIGDHIDVHLIARNLNSQSTINQEEYIGGVTFVINDGLRLHTEYVLQPMFDSDAFIIGIHYEPIAKVQVSLAINTLHQGPTLGLQYDNTNYLIAVAVSNHQQLGRSASLTLGGRLN